MAGSTALVRGYPSTTNGLADTGALITTLRDELLGKRYNYGRPDIVQQDWGKELQVYDPFGNRIRFCQY